MITIPASSPMKRRSSGVKEGSLVYTDNLADGTFSVSGEYGGEAIDLSQ